MHRPTPRVLVTGFEPFGGSTLNPSQVIAESFEQSQTRGADDGLDLRTGMELRTALLPVDTQRIAGVIDALWAEHEPAIVLHFGESAKADRLTLERVALNLLDFDTPDNAGHHAVDSPIDLMGPAARFATLPVRAVADRLSGAGVSSRLSLSAGAYLCNQTLYLSLAHAQQRGGRWVGFVHVPSLAEQAERGERSGPTIQRGELVEMAGRLLGVVVDLFQESEGGD